MANKLIKNNRITSRDVDFAQWYTDICLQAGLSDYSQIKGMMVFKPLGYAIWENIQKIVDLEFKKNGVQNVYFPSLIPSSLFKKEVEHIEGFAPEVATVTKVGDKKLEEDYYIRPTSEVLMCSQFAKDVKSYRDLPLIYNQWCNVIRWEKTTRPFLRSSEFLWQEGHTVHSTSDEAKDFTLKMLNIYSNIATRVLCLPVIKGQKTEHEKFSGAQETFTIETLMYDGQALQCGTSHYFGQNFSKVFNIKFENQAQTQEFAYSTSWGISTRLIGAIIMTHGDDNGLVLPFLIAPVQIQIILVKQENDLINFGKLIFNKLCDKYRVKIALDSNKSFGYQVSQAEMEGVPIRIEIGPKDLSNNQVVVARRDGEPKQFVKITELENFVDKLVIDYSDKLFKKANENMGKKILKINSISEYVNALKTTNVLALAPFCCTIDCEKQIKDSTSTTSRCIPFGESQIDNSTKVKCFNCDLMAKNWVYFARSY